MFQMFVENLMNTFNSLECPPHLIACGSHVFNLLGFTNFFGLPARFNFIRSANQNDALLPQSLGLRRIGMTTFVEQTSGKPPIAFSLS